MTDGNTYAINKHLDEREDYDALQEVTAELEQAEARIEELEAKLSKSEALWAKAVVNIRTYAPSLVDGPEHDVGYYYGYHTALARILDLLAAQKGQDDE